MVVALSASAAAVAKTTAAATVAETSAAAPAAETVEVSAQMCCTNNDNQLWYDIL